MVRPRYGRSVKGLGLGFRIENRQGQGHEQLEAVEDRLGAVSAERLQRRERHLFGYNSHPFGPMAVPTPSLYKYRALDPEFDTEFLRGTSAKIVRDTEQGPGRFSIQVLGHWLDFSWSDLDVLVCFVGNCLWESLSWELSEIIMNFN